MQAENIFRIVKAQSDRFTVVSDKGERIFCCSRKKNKKDELLAGDLVKLNGNIIESVCKRKNRLIRPAIANIDRIIFIVCSVPKPDFYLLDKVIVNCLKNGIDIIICINKSDINDGGFEPDIRAQYVGREVISISALAAGDTSKDCGNLLKFKQLLQGSLTCLAGQSAVGKSTLVSALTGTELKTGELSNIGRGRNTTTATELFEVCGGFLADTPGFNMLDIHSVEYTELALYYPEFEEAERGCKFRGCTHTTEPDCAVRAAAERGEINQKRYSRYLEIYQQLKSAYQNKF